MVICIVGLGYVGLPLSLAFSKKKIKVIGYDTSLKRIKELNQSRDINGEFSKEEISSSKNIIFTSSIAPYGIEDKLKDETTVPQPVTAYGSSKLQAEKIHVAWQKKDEANRILTIVRPGIVFGKFENANMTTT